MRHLTDQRSVDALACMWKKRGVTAGYQNLVCQIQIADGQFGGRIFAQCDCDLGIIFRAYSQRGRFAANGANNNLCSGR